MALSPAIAKIGNRKAPVLNSPGLFAVVLLGVLRFVFAYWHYSICKMCLQYVFPGIFCFILVFIGFILNAVAV